MSTRYGFGFVGVFCVVLLLLTAGPALAGSILADARVVLHIGPTPAPPSAKACLPVNTGVQEDCSSWDVYDTDFTVAGMTTRYALVITQAQEGVGGLSCGIEYTGNLFATFDLCTDGLEFSNNGWPGSGGGNRITWTTCGGSLDPNYADRYALTASGLQVVFGSFYVYTYGGDGVFRIIKNPLSPGTDDDELAVGTCAAQTTFLSILAAGWIGIGECQGYNPCSVFFRSDSALPSGCDPSPVIPTTWGGVKSRYGGSGDGGSP